MTSKLVGLVTGAASGLGRATVERLVKEGYKVTMCDLPCSKGSEVAAEFGDSVKFVPTDITIPDDVTNAVNLTKTHFGKLNVVVNCAGVSVSFKTYNFNKEKPHLVEDFMNVLNVNVVGTFNVIRLSVGLIDKNPPDENGQKGVIINTSSYSAMEGHTGQVAYSASTAAINGMTLPLARDMSSQGIRVCTIAPGLFDTPLLSALPDKVKVFFAKTTLFPQRLGKPEEYAALVLSIVENPFINGEIIRIDGGLRLL